jgi:hypothetical protein
VYLDCDQSKRYQHFGMTKKLIFAWIGVNFLACQCSLQPLVYFSSQCWLTHGQVKPQPIFWLAKSLAGKN